MVFGYLSIYKGYCKISDWCFRRYYTIIEGEKIGRKKPKLTLTAFLLSKNNLVKEYVVLASRKFNIGDETYVIKKDCCCPRFKDGKVEIVSYYTEGNPNPFNIKIGVLAAIDANDIPSTSGSVFAAFWEIFIAPAFPPRSFVYWSS